MLTYLTKIRPVHPPMKRRSCHESQDANYDQRRCRFFIWFSDAVRRAWLCGRSTFRGSLMSIARGWDSQSPGSFLASIFAIRCLTSYCESDALPRGVTTSRLGSGSGSDSNVAIGADFSLAAKLGPPIYLAKRWRCAYLTQNSTSVHPHEGGGSCHETANVCEITTPTSVQVFSFFFFFFCGSFSDACVGPGFAGRFTFGSLMSIAEKLDSQVAWSFCTILRHRLPDHYTVLVHTMHLVT